jgi:hypothetical protein
MTRYMIDLVHVNDLPGYPQPQPRAAYDKEVEGGGDEWVRGR